MNIASLLQHALFLSLVLVLVQPVGRHLQRVFDGERTILDPAMRPLERAIYRFAGVDPHEEMEVRGLDGPPGGSRPKRRQRLPDNARKGGAMTESMRGRVAW